MLRLATFNIKHGAPADKYRAKPQLVGEACAQLEADILALQEVDNNTFRVNRNDLTAQAAKATGMNAVFAKTMQFYAGSYGNALLVRGDIQDVEIVALGGSKRFKLARQHIKFGYEPRNALVATARINNQDISVGATHLTTEPGLQKQQLFQVLQRLYERPAPRVLLGDLNMTHRQIAAAGLLSAMDFVRAKPTFPVHEPRKQIDHIALDGLRHVHNQTHHMAVSDHLSLTVDAVL